VPGSLKNTCIVQISLVQALAPPGINFCKAITVQERTPTNTKFGTVVSATSTDASSSLVYSIANSSSVPAGTKAPFTLDCNGTLINTKTFYFQKFVTRTRILSYFVSINN
jgi:hypothetical protein